MKTRIENLLTEATIRTFEDTCFMYVEPELEDTQKNLPLEAAALVRFKGNYSGKLIIESRGELFSAIAANMLSNDRPSYQEKKDALGEIANIICGNLVPFLGRRKELGYRIESPVLLNEKELLKEKKEKPLAEVTLNFNQGRVDIQFFVDDYPSEEGKID